MALLAGVGLGCIQLGPALVQHSAQRDEFLIFTRDFEAEAAELAVELVAHRVPVGLDVPDLVFLLLQLLEKDPSLVLDAPEPLP